MRGKPEHIDEVSDPASAIGKGIGDVESQTEFVLRVSEVVEHHCKAHLLIIVVGAA